MVDVSLLASRVLDDEGLTSSLDEDEGQKLIAWLIARTERIAAESKTEDEAMSKVAQLCRRGRDVAKLIERACYDRDLESAAELAARKNLPWPVPEHAGPALEMLLAHLGRES